jgi:hypothetical protein
MFQLGQARLSMWHVWWHIGLRRYGAMQQQQQQQQQQGTDSIDALYLDPDAK